MSQRNYSYKDVVMLMTSKTIVQSLQNYRSELSLVRTNWTEAYVTELKGKINSAIEDFLGLDKKQPLREATSLLNEIKTPALRDLGFIKTQIEVDFGPNAAEILRTLGLTRDIHIMSQEELIQLLYSFKKGMTEQLKTTLTEKGANPGLIDGIVGYATQLEAANLGQEGLKASTREISQEAVDTFNSIYTEVSGICKIASKFYQNDRLKKDQFTFSKVVRNMGVSRENSEEPPVTE